MASKAAKKSSAKSKRSKKADKMAKADDLRNEVYEQQLNEILNFPSWMGADKDAAIEALNGLLDNSANAYDFAFSMAVNEGQWTIVEAVGAVNWSQIGWDGYTVAGGDWAAAGESHFELVEDIANDIAAEADQYWEQIFHAMNVDR